MSSSVYRGVVRGGSIVLADNAPQLADGTEVLVTPLSPASDLADVLEAMDAEPDVPPEVVDEFERVLAENFRPLQSKDVFLESDSSQAS